MRTRLFCRALNLFVLISRGQFLNYRETGRGKESMDFYKYLSRALPSSPAFASLSFGNLAYRAKEFFTFAVSAVIGIGTLLGAWTGVLIGREMGIGFIRGAAVGAISGAVFSLELFESSLLLLLWQPDESGIGCLLRSFDVIASLVSGRLVRERIGPAMMSAVRS